MTVLTLLRKGFIKSFFCLIMLVTTELQRFFITLSSSTVLFNLQEMDNSSQASSERILLEPYKYLLQLPGESLSCPVFRVMK